jgi:hypothetical protein
MLMLLALQTALPSEMGPAWGEFARRPALRQISDKVEIGTLGVLDRSTGTLRYWMRLTRVDKGQETVRWADSKSCAAVQGVLEGMAALPVPTLAPPGIGEKEPVKIMMDGVGYSLRTRSTYDGWPGSTTISSNVNTPLAAWVDKSLLDLADCWSATQPRRAT